MVFGFFCFCILQLELLISAIINSINFSLYAFFIIININIEFRLADFYKFFDHIYEYIYLTHCWQINENCSCLFVPHAKQICQTVSKTLLMICF